MLDANRPSCEETCDWVQTVLDETYDWMQTAELGTDYINIYRDAKIFVLGMKV